MVISRRDSAITISWDSKSAGEHGDLWLRFPWKGNTSQHSDTSLCLTATDLVLVVCGLWCTLSRMRCHSEVYQITNWHCSNLSCLNPSERRVKCLLYKVMQSRPQESGFSIQIPESSNERYRWKNTLGSLAHYFTLDSRQQRREMSSRSTPTAVDI